MVIKYPLLSSTPYKATIVVGVVLGIAGIVTWFGSILGLIDQEFWWGIIALIIGIGLMIAPFPILSFMIRRVRKGYEEEGLPPADPGAFEVFDKMLKDKDKEVNRREAAWILGIMYEKRALVSLISTLKDENKEVREFAAWSLGRIGDNKAVESLCWYQQQRT